MTPRLESIIALAVINLLAFLALWALSRLGPVVATMQGVIHRGDATVRFTVTNFVAAFAVILVIEIAAVHLLMR